MQMTDWIVYSVGIVCVILIWIAAGPAIIDMITGRE